MRHRARSRAARLCAAPVGASVPAGNVGVPLDHTAVTAGRDVRFGLRAGTGPARGYRPHLARWLAQHGLANRPGARWPQKE